MKICSVCKVEKPYNEFHRSVGHKSGYFCCCKICRKAQTQADYQKRKEYIKKKTLEYHYKNKQTRLQQRKIYQKQRLQTDPLFKSTRNLRNRLYYALKNKGWKKNTSFNEYIGLSDYNQLVTYLESMFTEQMNWDNYGSYWEIDHIIPLVSAKSQEELIKLCHYTNLQPLSVNENRIKRDKLK